MAGEQDRAPVLVRRLREGEEAVAVAVLEAAFGAWPEDPEVDDPVEHFRAKHLTGPLGPSLMFVAELDSRPVGFAAWLPCAFVADGDVINALRGVDLGVRPEYRGRGVAAALTPVGTQYAPPGTAFTMSNPNELSKRGVLRHGRTIVGHFPMLVRVRRPINAVRSRRVSTSKELTGTLPVTAVPAAELLADDRVSALLAEVDLPAGRLTTARDLDYLRWRYALDRYYGVIAETGGRVDGMALFRVTRRGTSWSTRICELLVADGDARVARRLLRSALAAAHVDYGVSHFGRGTMERRAAAACGFVRLWYRETVLVYPLRESIRPDPTDERSWALTLGDFDLL